MRAFFASAFAATAVAQEDDCLADANVLLQTKMNQKATLEHDYQYPMYGEGWYGPYDFEYEFDEFNPYYTYDGEGYKPHYEPYHGGAGYDYYLPYDPYGFYYGPYDVEYEFDGYHPYYTYDGEFYKPHYESYYGGAGFDYYLPYDLYGDHGHYYGPIYGDYSYADSYMPYYTYDKGMYTPHYGDYTYTNGGGYYLDAHCPSCEVAEASVMGGEADEASINLCLDCLDDMLAGDPCFEAHKACKGSPDLEDCHMAAEFSPACQTDHNPAVYEMEYAMPNATYIAMLQRRVQLAPPQAAVQTHGTKTGLSSGAAAGKSVFS